MQDGEGLVLYKVLYRKWRPSSFSDVVGQEHITVTLANEVKENRLAHAYLFTGSRGTGKTTCAKILSKAVNCLNPKDGNPCNECEICVGIDKGTILDIAEIDAASNRGIDDIRALREEVSFTPAKAKYRVYIIDEVHMLTIEAFNALLKTLEEPPSHVIFILATTEVHKLPSTIISRCQRFDFRRISPVSIAERLEFITESEGAKITRDAALLIARIADGGLRDAISLLDRCISVSSDITADVVAKAAGIAGRDYLFKMADAICRKDVDSILSILDELHNSSLDSDRLVTELVAHFRDIMIVKTVENPLDLIVCTEDELKTLKSLANSLTDEAIFRIINILTETAEKLRRSANRRALAELALIKICSEKDEKDLDSLLARIAALEKELASLKQNGFVSAPHTEPAYKAENKLIQKKAEDAHQTAAQTVNDDAFGFEEEDSPEPSPFELDNEPSFFDESFNNEIDTPPFDADIAPAPEEESIPFDEGGQDLPFGEGSLIALEPDISEIPQNDDFAYAETDAQPFAGDSAKTAEKNETSDIVLTPEMWNNITYEIGRQCPPLTGILGSISGYMENGVLVIKIGNALFCDLCSTKFSEQIHKAVEKAAGKAIRVKFI